ncbi:MAG: hypothetical protein KJO07_25430 [Deltaproteobacteria bacterium]|jgi:adhesin HecA-like repeat protein|nr:hypothetical protein [Deltaproteobacteria bacterium]
MSFRSIAIRLVLAVGLLAAGATSYVGWSLVDQAEFGPLRLEDSSQRAGQSFTIERQSLDQGYDLTASGRVVYRSSRTSRTAEVLVELLDRDGLVLSSQQVSVVAGSESSFDVYAYFDDLDCPGRTCLRTFTIRLQRVDNNEGFADVEGSLEVSAEGSGSDPPEGADLTVRVVGEDGQ